MMSMNGTSISRRHFLVRSAGLTLATALPLDAVAFDSAAAKTDYRQGQRFNVFVSITPDNRVVVTIKHVEMGQGPYTGLATIVAEELDAAWDQVESVSAPADKEKYKNLNLGMQMTGGSTAIANSWTQMREAGATARHMLLAAAAKQWGVPVDELSAAEGLVHHKASGRSLKFGELAVAAAAQPVPDSVRLKDPKNFVLVGRDFLRRKDTGKTDGSAIFTQDVQLPDMLTAVVAHPPVFGGKVKSLDAAKARDMPGVEAVVEIPSGVAVLAGTFWEAQKARQALEIDWDPGDGAGLSSESLIREYGKLTEKPGIVARDDGDADTVIAEDGDVVEADYVFPYLAHAAMEPMNCVVRKTDAGIEMWYGCQAQTLDQMNVAKVFGIEPDKVAIHGLYAGGSFGRRASADGNYVVEAAQIAKAYGRPVPIKLVWTREDDTQGGYYRPLYVHKLQATLDDKGRISAWRHRLAGQSIMGVAEGETDRTSVEGARNLPYAIPNLRVESHNTRTPVPPSWWRSVGSTHNAYAVETFIDELAHKAGRDPVAFRIELLGGHPRHRQVLELAAEKSGWGGKLPEGHFQGIAVHESFNSYVAQVAEIARQEDGKFKLVKVTCALDCGIAVNPDVIRQQMAGGIGYGLSPILFHEAVIDNGRPQQANFNDYPVVRMRHMPAVEVHIVPSGEAPTGVGEPGTPVVGPALANALFAATGKRYRRLPIGADVFAS